MTIHDVKMQQLIEAIFCEEKPDWFEQVYYDYLGSRMNAESKYLLELLRDVTYLENKIYVIDTCVEWLRMVYSEDMVIILKQNGITGRFDHNNKDQYQVDLKTATTTNKKNMSQLRVKKRELEQYQSRLSGNEIKREDFTSTSVELSKFMGFRVDFEVISVYEFCVMCNKYDAYLEVKNSQVNNLLEM